MSEIQHKSIFEAIIRALRVILPIFILAIVFNPSELLGQTDHFSENNQVAPFSILERSPDAKMPSQSVDAGQTIDRVLTKLALDSIPHTYIEDKNWGQQDERWDGIKWSRDGLRISTHRRKKKVNHGTWRKYSAELINPADEFSVQLKNLRRLDSGKTAFDVHFLAHLKIDARESKWMKGVQLYSLGAEGHTKVRLVVSCELAIRMDLTKFPPDLIFEPEVTDAKIIVEEFRLDRISKAGGEFAQQMTRAVRKVLDKKIEEKERKLVEKLNDQLEKNKDKLKISINDALKSKFAKQTRTFLPDDIQKAMSDSN